MRVLNPIIYQSNKDWREYYRNNNLNLPEQYHNGGIWRFVGGFYVAALVKAGRLDEAQRQLEKLAEVDRLGVDEEWEFNEWCHGRTGQPMGYPRQAWSAGMYVFAYNCVKWKGVYPSCNKKVRKCEATDTRTQRSYNEQEPFSAGYSRANKRCFALAQGRCANHLTSNGATAGTVGGGKLEAAILKDAQSALQDGVPKLTHYSLAERGGCSRTLCGGEVRVFIQPFLPPAQLIIVGGGHIGRPLKTMGEAAGFDVMSWMLRPAGQPCRKWKRSL